MDQETKVRENKLRRAADWQDLRLSKSRSRSRDPNALDFELYAVIDVQTGEATHPAKAGRWVHTLTLDEVEAHLGGAGA